MPFKPKPKETKKLPKMPKQTFDRDMFRDNDCIYKALGELTKAMELYCESKLQEQLEKNAI